MSWKQESDTDEYDEMTLMYCLSLFLCTVLFFSWLLMIVFMHFIREYGKSGFKVRMCNLYCSVKEVLSSLYIVSHWVCTAIVISLLIIDYRIDGN